MPQQSSITIWKQEYVNSSLNSTNKNIALHTLRCSEVQLIENQNNVIRSDKVRKGRDDVRTHGNAEDDVIGEMFKWRRRIRQLGLDQGPNKIAFVEKNEGENYCEDCPSHFGFSLDFASFSIEIEW